MLHDNSPEALKLAEALGMTDEGQKKLMEARKLRLEKAAELKKNANEIMHTTNTGYGAELIPTNVLQAEIFDSIPQFSTFLSLLPGFHGFNMGKSELVPVIGSVKKFQGNSEPTTGALAIAQGVTRLPTDNVTITQVPFLISVDVSRSELNHSVTDLQALLIRKLAEAWTETAEALMVNGDSETGGTGNVNSDDQAPATTFATEGGASYYALQIDHGIREIGINGTTATSVNVGTLEVADFLSLRKLLGKYASKPQDLLWIFSAEVYNKALGLQAFYDAAQRGEKSTLSGSAITNIFGTDLVIAKDMPNTEADGKVSATAANNTLGQLALIWKPSIQFGYGQQFELDVVKIPGKGIQIIATCEFGFTIVQKKAGVTDSSLAVGYNVTIS